MKKRESEISGFSSSQTESGNKKFPVFRQTQCLSKNGEAKKKRGIFNSKIFKGNKKAMEMEVIGWWIIAIAILIIMLTGYFILKGKGIEALDYLRNLFRFGG